MIYLVELQCIDCKIEIMQKKFVECHTLRKDCEHTLFIKNHVHYTICRTICQYDTDINLLYLLNLYEASRL